MAGIKEISLVNIVPGGDVTGILPQGNLFKKIFNENQSQLLWLEEAVLPTILKMLALLAQLQGRIAPP